MKKMLTQNLGFMTKRCLLSVLFILNLSLSLWANSDSLQKTSLYSFEVMHMQNPWLFSGNPTALSQANMLLPAIINVNYNYENGDYKRVQQGDQLSLYNFSTFSYSKIKDISLFGKFSYDKSFEKGLDFSNMNDPFRLTPYQIIDTLGNDTYDREFFSVAGGVSKPLGQRLTLGLSGDFVVGLAAQNKDPRPQNKVFTLNVSPGMSYKLGKFTLGFNLLYAYYTEEIEITIIRENYQAVFFSVYGLGTAISDETESFNRLYKRNSGGAETQLFYQNTKIKSVSGASLKYYEEKAGNGIKSTNATWSYIRKNSRLNGLLFDAYNNTSYFGENNIQQTGIALKINTMLGQEIIQKLDPIEGTDLEDWVTYALEQKYGAKDYQIDVFYQYLKLKNGSQENFLAKVFANYHYFKHNYYLPNQEEYYKNLMFGATFNKVFLLGNKTLTVGLNMKYKLNIDGSQNFSDYTFIAEKILVPDYEYLTSNYYAPGLEFAFEIPLKKLFDQFFIKSTVDMYQGNNGQSRTIFNFSTGVTF